MMKTVLPELMTSLICKNDQRELILLHWPLRPPGGRWQPSPHSNVRCLATQAGLTKKVSRIILMTLTWPPRWERSCWFDRGFPWRHCQYAGEPFFLSNIYTLERSAVVPFTSSQVRGVSGNLPQRPHECPLLCEGHTGLVSDPCPRTQKARSCGWHKEWAQLVGHGHTAWAAGTRMYRRGLGSAHHRAGVGSLACLLLLPRGADVPWGPFRGTGQKTLAGRGQVCSGVP